MGKAIKRFFTDRETQAEIGKFLIIILLLGIYLAIFRAGQLAVRLWRWGACIMIFLLFIIINQLFLYHHNPANFYLSPLVVVISLLIMHLVIERIVLKRLAEKEKTDLREMIARDLHDDLASTLGTISIYSDTLHALKEPAPDNVNKLSAKISDLAHHAKQSITDIIWMTSPRNDTCQGLILKSSNLLMDIMNDNDIRFEHEIHVPDAPVVLEERLRNNAFLIMKEGLHNIIRHSKASQVVFYAEIKDNRCFIHLTDNGLGFNIDNHSGEHLPGNGLINMRKRAMESGIGLSISSKPGEGAKIELDFAI
jgi:signal transduction histidine kinase